jgi:hypothetical protein
LPWITYELPVSSTMQQDANVFAMCLERHFSNSKYNPNLEDTNLQMYCVPAP